MTAPRWVERLACAVKVLGGTDSTTIVVGLLLVVGIYQTVATAALASVIHEIMTGRGLPPDPRWIDVLDSMLMAALALAGVGGLTKIGKRATAKPDVITAEAAAEARTVAPAALREDAP